MTRRLLSEAEGYGLLKNHGIPVPGFSVITSRQDVCTAAERTGYPLVMIDGSNLPLDENIAVTAAVSVLAKARIVAEE